MEKKISETISQIDIRLKPQQYCHDVLKTICNHLGYDFGSIILIDNNGKGNLFSAYNLPENYLNLVNRSSSSILSSPSGVAIREKRAVVVNDVMSDIRLLPWHDLLKGMWINTIVWVPMYRSGEPFGTYNLYDRRNREISEKEISILDQIAILLSMTIRSNEYIDEIQEKSNRLKKEIEERIQIEWEFVQAKEKAEAANIAKSHFLANMTHEIRTPLHAVIGYSNILLDDEEDPDKIDHLKTILESSNNLLKLLTNLLDLSAVETGRLDFKNSKFSINEIMEQLDIEFEDISREKNIPFHFTLDSSVPAIVFGDSYRVHQAIFNVVENAFKFTEKGKVSIIAKYDPENHLGIFEISDTGIGIETDKMDSIFELFTQADGSLSRRFGGIGLGLTLTHKLLERMGGTIRVESTPGLGSIFTLQITLPEVLEE